MRVYFANRMQLTEVAVVDEVAFWQLENPFYIHVYDEKSEEQTVEIIIEKWFVTDLCSVPRMPFAHLLFGGIANRAGGMHDGLYSNWAKIVARKLFSGEKHEVTKAWADDVFYAGLIACGVPAWKAYWMWMGVKVFGGRHFRAEHKFKHGEQILAEY
jgi:hypothetical protein